MKFLFAEQHAALTQKIDDVDVGVEDIFADKIWQTRFVGETTVIIYRRQDWKIVLPPQHVIVRPMPGRDVHRAGPRVHGHEIGREDCHFAIEKGMACFGILKLCARKRRERFADWLELCDRGKLRDEFLCQQQSFRYTIA